MRERVLHLRLLQSDPYCTLWQNDLFRNSASLLRSPATFFDHTSHYEIGRTQISKI
uniref:Uncharacterized protein n=1 Tax=Anopheles funestus TaxID=62324 RepID=A0A182S3M5_ANOFN